MGREEPQEGEVRGQRTTLGGSNPQAAPGFSRLLIHSLVLSLVSGKVRLLLLLLLMMRIWWSWGLLGWVICSFTI